MIKLAALIGAAAALLALSAPASAEDKHIEALYSVRASMGTVGEFSYDFTQDGTSYTAEAERRVTGLLRGLAGSSQDYRYSVRGVLDGGKLQPQAYRHQGGRHNRVVQATFTPTDVATTRNNEPQAPRVSAALRRGVVDQLTAIAAMATAAGGPCAGTIPVYMDGRARFDFVAQPAGAVQARTRAYRGEAIRCRVRFNPLGGFGDPQEPADLTFLFVERGGVYAPITIQMPTDDVGVVTLEAKSMSVNGQRL